MKFELILMLVLTSTTISCCYDILEVVEAKPGDNVTLKCVSVSGNISELEWTRDGLAQDKSVFLYKDNKVKEGAIDPRVKDRVTWKDPQTADIILKNVTVSDTGLYKCWVYIQDQKSAADGVDHNPPDREINLIVTDEIYKVMAKPGDNVTLECVSVSGNFNQLQWIRVGLAEDNYVFFYQYNKVDKEVIDQRFQDRVTRKDSQTSDIVLKNVTVKDTGKYQCLVKVEAGDNGGDGGSRSHLVTAAVLSVLGVVAVAAGVVFLVVRRWRQRGTYKVVKVESEVVRAKPGDDVTLKCVSVSGEINLLEWTRDDLAKNKYIFFYQDNKVDEEVIDQRFKGRVTLKGPQTADIILENVTVSDTGIYLCVVNGENLHQNEVVNLMVTDDVPLLAKVVVEVEAKRGDDVTLKCDSVSGEINLLKWTREDLTVDECVFFYQNNNVDEGAIDPRFQGRVTLKRPKTADIVLKNVTVNDTGTYKCWVYLKENQHQDGAAVGVDDPPHGVFNLIVTDSEFPDFKTPHLKVKDPGHKVQGPHL